MSRAREYGFDGIDFRGYCGQMEIFRLPEFSSDLERTRQLVAGAGLDVPCFSSSARAFWEDEAGLEKSLEEVRAYAGLCEAFGAPFIRVFGGRIGSTPRDRAIERATEGLARMVDAVSGKNVVLLLETHDDWIAGEHLESVMRRLDSDRVGILWDTHHPYRMLGEEPRATWESLGRWVRYTHVKDSIADTGSKAGYRLCLPGDGDVALEEIVGVLTGGGYDGYLALEWEKVWHPEMEEPEAAFPKFVEVMRSILPPT